MAQPYADKLYVIECGQGHAEDQGRWSPGVNVGKGFDLADNCYLIRHGADWFLWDTGIPDSIAALPDGERNSFTGTTWKRSSTLAAQLAALGVAPDQLRWIGLSHTHPDHSGNLALFPHTTLLVQAAEYNWKQADGSPRFPPQQPVKQVSGDYDVFGDGSVTILSTPGHTPGHQSLLVKLHNTGAVVLSGDAVHFKDNWDKRRVPALNADAAASRASLEKIAQVMETEHAQLWINHDVPQSKAQKHSPEFYD
ncbi:N-acyl homoserine lactonase family protein [Janthinobacterium agaricidamnosum]|nr:N-acyl homoserine lactonase family protein [Janthinobacterium agaricidamnosum]